MEPIKWDDESKARSFDIIEKWLADNGYLLSNPKPHEVHEVAIGLFVRSEGKRKASN